MEFIIVVTIFLLGFLLILALFSSCEEEASYSRSLNHIEHQAHQEMDEASEEFLSKVREITRR
jgi:hypothetical protein